MTQPDSGGQSTQRWAADAHDADAFHVMSLLISGVLFWGGIGWGIGLWVGVPALAGVGIVFGGVLGVWAVWLRYGRPLSGPPGPVGPDSLRPHQSVAALVQPAEEDKP